MLVFLKKLSPSLQDTKHCSSMSIHLQLKYKQPGWLYPRRHLLKVALQKIEEDVKVDLRMRVDLRVVAIF